MTMEILKKSECDASSEQDKAKIPSMTRSGKIYKTI